MLFITLSSLSMQRNQNIKKKLLLIIYRVYNLTFASLIVGIHVTSLVVVKQITKQNVKSMQIILCDLMCLIRERLWPRDKLWLKIDAIISYENVALRMKPYIIVDAKRHIFALKADFTYNIKYRLEMWLTNVGYEFEQTFATLLFYFWYIIACKCSSTHV